MRVVRVVASRVLLSPSRTLLVLICSPLGGLECELRMLCPKAIIGMFFQDGLTGSAWGDWALYTGSPLRAFESELGVQDPVGFWDPAGFTVGALAACGVGWQARVSLTSGRDEEGQSLEYSLGSSGILEIRSEWRRVMLRPKSVKQAEASHQGGWLRGELPAPPPDRAEARPRPRLSSLRSVWGMPPSMFREKASGGCCLMVCAPRVLEYVSNLSSISYQMWSDVWPRWVGAVPGVLLAVSVA